MVPRAPVTPTRDSGESAATRGARQEPDRHVGGVDVRRRRFDRRDSRSLLLWLVEYINFDLNPVADTDNGAIFANDKLPRAASARRGCVGKGLASRSKSRGRARSAENSGGSSDGDVMVGDILQDD